MSTRPLRGSYAGPAPALHVLVIDPLRPARNSDQPALTRSQPTVTRTNPYQPVPTRTNPHQPAPTPEPGFSPGLYNRGIHSARNAGTKYLQPKE